MAKVIEGRSAASVPEHSPVGESPSNGITENSVKRLQGIIRTLKRDDGGQNWSCNNVTACDIPMVGAMVWADMNTIRG